MFLIPTECVILYPKLFILNKKPVKFFFEHSICSI